MQASIYITVDTLKYLKKGGRITPAAAAIGTDLNLKPCTSDSGREAGRLRKGKRLEISEKNYAECD